MTIAVNTFKVGRVKAIRPVNATNQYAFSPALAKALVDLPIDDQSVVLVPVPEGLPKKHGFVRAVRIFIHHNAPGTYDVSLTVDGDEVQIMKRPDPAPAPLTPETSSV